MKNMGAVSKQLKIKARAVTKNGKAVTTIFKKSYWKNWVRKKKWPQYSKYSQELRIVDLFCGCGGMSLGVMEAAAAKGYKCSIALASDISIDASLVYRKNYAPFLESYFEADLSTLFPPEGKSKGSIKLRNHYGKIDILLAGPPCQGHSNLNNSTRRDDPRNQLYLSAITAIEVLQPTICIIENVPAVIHDKGLVIKNSHERLIKAGYAVAEIIIRMDEIGLAQRRKRHMLIACKNSKFETLPLSNLTPSSANLEDFIGDIKKEWMSSEGIFCTPSNMSNQNVKRMNLLMQMDANDLPDSARPPCHKDKIHSYKSAYGRLSWDLPAQTITSGFGSMGQGRYIHPSEPRTITPHEAARIQGFPDFFDFSPVGKRTNLQEIIANAVPPPAIATVVREILEKTFTKEISS
jgi:DNA (cytosine-5)-methyltransferase 1